MHEKESRLRPYRLSTENEIGTEQVFCLFRANQKSKLKIAQHLPKKGA